MSSTPMNPVLRLQTIAAAILPAPVILMVILLVLRFTEPEFENGLNMIEESLTLPLQIVLGLIVLSSAGASVIYRSVVASRQLAVSNTLATRTRIVLIGMAIAEVGATFGFVWGLMTGDLVTAAVYIGIPFATMLYHFPTRAWIEQAEDVESGETAL